MSRVSGSPEFRIERVGFGHPDAMRLIAEVQLEYVERYGGPDDTPLDPAMFEPPTGSFFVGYLAGQPVVTGAWRRHDEIPEHPGALTTEIKRMYVASAARGRGLARLMLAHLEATAGAAGHDVLILETGTRQPEAMALYESSGYTPVAGFGYYKDEPLSRCYAKALTHDRTRS